MDMVAQHIPVIPAFGRLRQEDCHRLKESQGYKARPVSINKKQSKNIKLLKLISMETINIFSQTFYHLVTKFPNNLLFSWN